MQRPKPPRASQSLPEPQDPACSANQRNAAGSGFESQNRRIQRNPRNDLQSAESRSKVPTNGKDPQTKNKEHDMKAEMHKIQMHINDSRFILATAMEGGYDADFTPEQIEEIVRSSEKQLSYHSAGLARLQNAK